MQKSIAPIIVLLALFFTLIGLFYFKNKENNQSSSITQTQKHVASWKKYENTRFGFAIFYPEEWRMLEGTDSVKWYPYDSQSQLDPTVLNIWWYDPQIRYDIAQRCDKAKKCTQESQVITRDEGISISIWKPSEALRKQSGLSSQFLYGFITNTKKSVIPEFSTDTLSINEFKSVLSTFRLTE